MHEILLVEDSASDAHLTERTLQSAGVCNPVRHVFNGGEAITYLETAALAARNGIKPVPSILLLDLKLPDISGFDILAIVQAKPELAKLLRIVLTAHGDIVSVRKAYAAGAHSFLNKPIVAHDIDGLIVSFPTYWLLSDAARLRSKAAQPIRSSGSTGEAPRAQISPDAQARNGTGLNENGKQ